MKNLLLAVCVFGVLENVVAAVSVPAIFSDHAVLQRSVSTPVWGRAEAGEKVVVTLGEVRAETVAASDGRWRVDLDLTASGPGPWELVVEGANRLVVADVLVGEVWLCSGQSNMYWPLRQTTGGPGEIAASANPRLRQFRVATAASLSPKEDCVGQWTVASPATSGDFTGVGYYFGQSLQKTLGVPVGLINSTWGGTSVEAWTSEEALDRDAGLKAAKDRAHRTVEEFPKVREQFAARLGAWLETSGRRDDQAAAPEGFAAPGISTDDWLPAEFPAASLPKGMEGPGIFWLRREVEIPAYLAGKKLPLQFEPLAGFDAVYWNGKKIGGTGLADYPGDGAPRSYTVPADQVTAGKATLAIRLYAPHRPVRIQGRPDRVKAGSLVIGGKWLAKTERLFSDGEKPPASLAAPPSLHNVSGALFNTMILPLVPYGIRGVVWYQGEANVGRAAEYRRAFPLLIDDWRAQWKHGELPFYFCQLPNFSARQDQPSEHSWPPLREAQASVLSKPNTGMAVLIDVGEADDIHPRNKKDPGQRLARIALARDYGKPVSFEGPVLKDARVESGAMRLTFRPNGGGLAVSSPPGSGANVPLRGFSICGADRQWEWASATIEGDDVVVSSPKVPAPVAVRYAWAGNPDCNLVNQDGLPAAPFRTDDFALPASH